MEWVDRLRDVVSAIEDSGPWLSAEVDTTESFHCDDDLAPVGIGEPVTEAQASQDCPSDGTRWAVSCI